MNTYRHIQPVFYGFMLLSFFFGAGNLIFPPMLGMNSGTLFPQAVTGFILTAIALPMMTVIVIVRSPDGLMGIGRRVHPMFALPFAILIYLSIGAMYGIPRASNVGYEIGFKHLTDLPDSIGLVIYVVVFFTVCYFAALHSSYLVELIGKMLTPLLLLSIALLCALAFMSLSPSGHGATEKFAEHPFTAGIIEGYFTMDALAALAFGSVLANAVIAREGKGANSVAIMVQASCVAALCLGVIYFCLAWIGRTVHETAGYANGADLLSAVSAQLMGKAGHVVFGIIVMLACLTTCIGLINACASFAKRLYAKIDYAYYVLLFTVIGAIFSNLGLQRILAIAIPILVFLYPISIALVVLSMLHPLIRCRRWTYTLGVGVTVLMAFQDLLSSLSITLPWQSLLDKLPLAELGLGWIMPFVVMSVLGYFISPQGQSLD